MNFLFLFYDGSYHETNVGSCSCRPQSMAHIKQSKFSCHVMTFLCSLGKLAALLVGLGIGFMMLFKIYISHYEKHVRTREITFYCDIQFTGRENCHMEMVSITWHYKQTLAITEGGYETFTVRQ